MRNSTLLCRRGLMGIALQARHLNENLENNLQLESFSVSSVCSVDYSVATLEILEEIFNKEWPGPEMLWIHGAHGGHGSSEIIHGIIFL